ncbi:TPA: hypothetical protein ACP32N_005047 [Pseudomonas aeruginosa]
MKKGPTFILAAALLAAANAHAGDRLQIEAVLTKEGKVIASEMKNISNGEIAHFRKTETREFDVNAVKRPKGIEVTKQKVNLGFVANIYVREMSTGKFMLDVKGEYDELVKEKDLKSGDLVLHVGDVRRRLLAGTPNVGSGETVEIVDPLSGDLKLAVTIKRL